MKVCESLRQPVQGAHKTADVFRVFEVMDKGDLRGLVVEIPSELPPADSSAQLLFIPSEEMFCDIVGSLGNGDSAAIFIQLRRMSE